MMIYPPDSFLAEALDIIRKGDVRVSGEPVLYTSCCKDSARKYVAENTNCSLIVDSPAGKKLEEMDLFSKLPLGHAYLYWFYLSARFVVENDFPEDVLIFADFDNPSSAAYGVEIPLLFNLKPDVRSLSNPLEEITVPREEWAARNLIRAYVLELVNSHWVEALSPDRSGRDFTLIDRFQQTCNCGGKSPEYVAKNELILRVLLGGYLKINGQFPTNPAYGNSPYSFSLSKGMPT